MSKLSDAVKNDVVKKDVYDTYDFKLKTKYQTDKTDLEKKIPNVTDFVKEAKLTEFEKKISDVSNLATKIAFTTAENKIPDVSSRVKKTSNNAKVIEIENKLTDHNHYKYITTSEFNTLAKDVFNARLAQDNLITKTDFHAKLSRINREITASKTKNSLIKSELNKLITFDSSYFINKSHFERDGTQNYLVPQPLKK